MMHRTSSVDSVDRLKRQVIDLERQLREKDGEVKRLSVRRTLDKDSRRLHLLEDRLRESIRGSEALEAQVANFKEREGRLTYELEVTRGVISLRDHPDLLREADTQFKYKTMEQDNRLLREELIGISERCKVFQEVSNRSQQESEQLKSKLVLLDSELERAMIELREVYNEREYFQAEEDQLQKKIASQKKAVETANAELRDHQKNGALLKEKMSTLQRELSECRTDEEHAKRTWQEGHRLLELKMKEADELALQLSQVATRKRFEVEEESTALQRVAVLQQSLEAVSGENAILREQRLILQHRAEEVDTMSSRLNCTDTEMSALLSTIKTQEGQLQAAASLASDLQKINQSLTQQLAASRCECKEHDEELHQLSKSLGDRIDAVERERDAAAERVQVLQVEVKEQQDKISMLSAVATHHQSLNRAAAQATLNTGSASDRLSRLLHKDPTLSHHSAPPEAARHQYGGSSQPVAPTPLAQRWNGNMSDVAVSPPTPAAGKK